MTERNPQMPRFVTEAECQATVDAAVAAALLKIARAPRPFKVFGLNSSQGYADKVCEHLGIDRTPHEEKLFDDGENYAKSDDKPVGNVRGHDVFVIQSLYSDQRIDPDTNEIVGESVSDKFTKLCWMIGSLKDASAHEVTAIIPHLGWARQDRKTASREPVTTKYRAKILEAVGMNRGLFFDVHNLAAEQNAFTVPIDNLEAKNLFADFCAEKLKTSKKIAVLTPDAGGLHRANSFRGALVNRLRRIDPSIVEDIIEIAIYDKIRVKGKVKGGRIIGDVDGADVIAYDDMISTGGTMKSACRAAEKAGGNLFAICATHGLFCGTANEVFDDFDTNIVVADTVEPFRLNENNRKKVQTVSTAKMMADAVLRIHYGIGSISELLK
jgi:ribose-phosphate pyrophosphokinase